MASDCSRARIDQFFSSKKKRKNLSPASKSGRQEIEAKYKIEGSPSAKGSLESFLEISNNGTSPAKSSNAVSGYKGRQVPVKRNLSSEAGLLSEDENQEAPHVQPLRPEASEVAGGSKLEPLCDIGSVATIGIQKDSSIARAIVQNSELKEFATGFLSLYCGELQSSLSLPSEMKEIAAKRHSSPSTLQLEEKPSKRRHCSGEGNQSDIHNESISSPKNIHSKIVDESKDISSNCLEKVTMDNNLLASQASLRKCSNSSALCTNECGTPGSLRTRLGARGTPQSTQGSSLFSPGEAFWNEAILVADGLFDPNDASSSHAAESDEAIQVDYVAHDNLKNGGRVDLSDIAPGGIMDKAVVGSLGQHVKDLNKEASPLPVKHFDFSFEAKFFHKETPSDNNNNTKADVLASEEKTLASISQPSLPHYNIIWSKDQKSEILSDAQGTSIKCINFKITEELLNQNKHSAVSMTPNRENNKIAAANESKSSCTPASSSIKDLLDLSIWLPLEICHVYNKKGISKLYPWQCGFKNKSCKENIILNIIVQARSMSVL